MYKCKQYVIEMSTNLEYKELLLLLILISRFYGEHTNVPPTSNQSFGDQSTCIHKFTVWVTFVNMTLKTPCDFIFFVFQNSCELFFHAVWMTVKCRRNCGG